MYQLLDNKEIDKLKWDEVVDLSYQSQVYATSQYLNIFFPNWKGLVWKDETGGYMAVAPIYEKTYLFFKTCLQPPFIQQGGVFCLPNIDQAAYVLELINFLRKRYTKLVYNLNVYNSSIEITGNHSIRVNYVLDIKSFSSNQLNKNRKRDLKLTEKKSLLFSKQKVKYFTKEEFLFFSSKSKSVKLKHLKKINRLTEIPFTSVFEIRDDNNVLLSKVLMVEYQNKVCYLLPINYNALQKGISTKMILELIPFYTGKKEILDFEGGSLKNMAQFYRGFGAIKEVYKSIS